MSEVEAYQVSINPSRLDDLKARLRLAHFPDELDAAEWDMGAPLADIKRLTQHWLESYDWSTTEAEFNKLPQFVTDIQCTERGEFEPLAIHFVHQRNEKCAERAIPLLFVHGWPGSFLEATKILGPLDEGDGVETPAFHIVVPSLPNFGFSQGTRKRGFTLEQYAETLNKLMLKLGYKEYVAQGGDWGCHISRTLAHLYPQYCKATLLNYDFAQPPSFLKNPVLAAQHALTPYSAREKEGLSRGRWFDDEGRGYSTEQRTKPQTLGYALADSPVGLLAWIYEKLHDWTDSYPWTDDEICAWVSVYWFSVAGPAASLRIYYESGHNAKQRADKLGPDELKKWSPGVKLGFSHFPRDLHPLPQTWMGTLGEVVFEKNHEGGGHFAAWERPDELVMDIKGMFGRGGGAFGVVKGCRGYA